MPLIQFRVQNDNKIEVTSYDIKILKIIGVDCVHYTIFNASTLAVETWLLQKKNTKYLAIKQQCTAERSDIFYVKCPFAQQVLAFLFLLDTFSTQASLGQLEATACDKIFREQKLRPWGSNYSRQDLRLIICSSCREQY